MNVEGDIYDKNLAEREREREREREYANSFKVIV